MRPGWNPTRRNRNIGTKAQGYGQNNSLVIPSSHHKSQAFFEDLKDYVVVRRLIQEKERVFIVEPIRAADAFYPCTVDDIAYLLSKLRSVLLDVFDFVVFRQPTRKQNILRSVWGRADFDFRLTPFRGRAIIIEAHTNEILRWSKSVDVESAKELDRLVLDGHRIENTSRSINIHLNAESVRNTVLYRTVLHELGHCVDYELATADEWITKITREKEDAAHRFAAEMYESLRQDNCVPFNQIIDLEQMQLEGLSPRWFLAPTNT
jgi:hypothetical protein